MHCKLLVLCSVPLLLLLALCVCSVSANAVAKPQQPPHEQPSHHGYMPPNPFFNPQQPPFVPPWWHGFVPPQPRPNLYRIDTHAHYLPPFYLAYMKERNITSGGRPWPAWSPADHIAFMDSHAIRTSVVSLSTPGVRLPGEPVESGRKLARQVNEYGAQLAANYSGRFQFLAHLTLPDVDGALAEAKYAFDSLKALGVVLETNVFGQYLGSPAFDPLMEELNKRHATVFVHPNDVFGLPSIGLPSSMVDFPFDTTRAVMNMLKINITGRFPNIHWVLAHSGGCLPFLAYRVAPLFPDGALAAMKSLFVDTALSSSDSALPSTLEFLTAGHIAFGTDYPFAPITAIDQFVAMFDKFPLMPPHRAMIDFQNAAHLFKVPAAYKF